MKPCSMFVLNAVLCCSEIYFFFFKFTPCRMLFPGVISFKFSVDVVVVISFFVESILEILKTGFLQYYILRGCCSNSINKI